MTTKVVMLIHGMWTAGWCWDNFRSPLEEAGYRCVAITLPYHDMDPRSDPDPRLGALGLSDYVAALEREVDRLGSPPIVIGHSMGGLLALILGSRGLATKLVLLAPAWPAGLVLIPPLSTMRSFLALQRTWGFWRKPMRPSFEVAARAILHRLPAAAQRETFDRFVFESGRAATQIGYWFLYPDRPSAVDLAAVPCPTLLVAGGQDRLIPASLVRRMADAMMGAATFRVFPENGHWLLGEPDSRQLARYVLAWLNPTLGRDAIAETSLQVGSGLLHRT